MSTSQVRIHYIRPGKDATEYVEDLIAEDEHCLRTFKVFPQEVAAGLTRSLHHQGFIAKDQTTTCITKTYFFHEHFDLLQFQNEHGKILGYYSDIGTPLVRTAAGYEMTDWFLDIWLSPDGTLFELDIDEFDEALAQHLLTPAEAEIARTTFARLIAEVKQGIYPNAYIE